MHYTDTIAWIALVTSVLSLIISYRNYALSHQTKTEEKKTEAVLIARRLIIIYQDLESEYTRALHKLEQGWHGTSPEHTVAKISEFRYRINMLKSKYTKEVEDLNKLTPKSFAKMEYITRRLKDDQMKADDLLLYTRSDLEQLKPHVDYTRI